MARPAYKKGNAYGAVWALFLFLGVVGELVVGYLVIRPHSGPIILLWMCLPFIFAVILGLFVTSRLNRKRIQRMLDVLKGLGFEAIPDPTPEQKVELITPIDSSVRWIGLGDRVNQVLWCAVKPMERGSARIFEHEFTTGSSRSTQTYHYTVLAWYEPPANEQNWIGFWPMFSIGRANVSMTRLLRKGSLTLGPELSGFMKDFIAHGASSSAEAFLTPKVRDLIADAPQGEVWIVGDGWVVLAFKSVLDARSIEVFVRRMQRVLAAFPT